MIQSLIFRSVNRRAQIESVLLAIALLIIPPQLSAQSQPPALIIGFQEKVVKVSVSRGGAQFRDALKTILPSARRREISVATAGRLKRNVINSIARGFQSNFKYIGAKSVASSRAPDQAKVLAAQRMGLVRYVTPDIRLQMSALPNDPSLGSLWGLQNNTGGLFSVRDVDINAPEAWEISSGSDSVLVAVLDTGIDPSHPDLAQNIWVNKGEIPANGKDDDQNGYIDDVNGCNFTVFDQGKTSSCGPKPYNQHYHGTHVAGTIGARGDNGQGISGVAQRVGLVSLAFLDDQGGGSLTDMLEAMGYAIELKRRAQRGIPGGANIKVINGSFGHNEGFTQPEFDAFKALEDAGILFVAAAGNGGPDGVGDNNDTKATFPASYDIDSLISVAAVGKTGALTYFSNYGAESVDIAAPGSGITSTVFDGKYAAESGTSMAAPHVAGAAALLFSIKPDFSPWIAKQMIVASGKDAGSIASLSSLSGKLASAAMLDAASMLKLAQSDLSRPKVLRDPKNQSVPKGSTLTLSVQAFSSSTLSYRWLKDGNEVAGANKATLTVRNAGVDSAGSYYCVVSSGAQSAQSAPAKVSITDELKSDINGDGKVTFADMMALFADIGKTGPGLRSDLNQDQVVDFKDLDLLLKTTKFK